MVTFDLLLICVIVLLLVLIVLLVVCCVLRRSRSRNLTELRISEGQNPFVLTIKTEQDHAEELLDQLLEWFFLEEELHDESGGDAEAEQQEEIDLEHGSESDASTPETSHHTRATSSVEDQTDDLTSHHVSQQPPQAEEQRDESQL